MRGSRAPPRQARELLAAERLEREPAAAAERLLDRGVEGAARRDQHERYLLDRGEAQQDAPRALAEGVHVRRRRWRAGPGTRSRGGGRRPPCRSGPPSSAGSSRRSGGLRSNSGRPAARGVTASRARAARGTRRSASASSLPARAWIASSTASAKGAKGAPRSGPRAPATRRTRTPGSRREANSARSREQAEPALPADECRLARAGGERARRHRVPARRAGRLARRREESPLSSMEMAAAAAGPRSAGGHRSEPSARAAAAALRGRSPGSRRRSAATRSASAPGIPRIAHIGARRLLAKPGGGELARAGGISERDIPEQRLVRDRPHRVEVGCGRRRLAPEELGGHVAERAHHLLAGAAPHLEVEGGS